MHVLITVLHRPVAPTGVCRYAANLVKCLVSHEFVRRVTLVIGSWQKDYFKSPFLVSCDKIELVFVDIKNTSFSRNTWFLFGLPNLVNALSPDIVHLSFPLPFLRSRFACPVVATIHDLYPYQFPENFGWKQVFFNRLFLQQCIRNSDALTCVSQVTANDLNHYFPEVSTQGKKVTVIYNFVDFSQIQPKIPRALQNDPNCSFILCVGQHRKNKNIDLLIQSYATLIQKELLDKNTRLIIVGSSGPETTHLKELIEQLSLKDCVLMLSAINDEELCWLYRSSQVFAIASSLEGFCIPLVEALYFSCRTVCSDIPIFREVGSSHCTYFDLEGDAVRNLAYAITQSLASEKTEESENCLRFSKATVSDQLLKFYTELM